MERRRFLGTAAAGLAGLTALAGCSGTGGDDARTVNPALRETPTETPTATPARTAFGAGDADSLERSRSLVVTNQLVRPEWVTVSISESDTPVFQQTLRVPPATRRTVGGVFGAARTFTASVTTADGRARRFDWRPGPGGDHLGVDLDGGISVRDTFPVSAAGEFIEGSTGGLLANTPATAGALLVVDTPGDGGRLRLTASDGDSSAGIDLRVPPRSRVPLPLSVPRGQLVVAAETPDGTDRRRWRPFEDGALYCVLDSAPRLVCDLLIRDVVVENATGSGPGDGVTITVDADGQRVLDRTTYPPPGGNVRIPTAVPPAGTYVVSVRHGRLDARRTLSRCPADGPFVVTVGEDGIAVESRSVGSPSDGEQQGETPTGTPPDAVTEPPSETANATETASESFGRGGFL
ncbi:hypothetical protein [Halobaculum limi]|uniref:hypothetical protein n=1 Tax=Halobaculum limi TaxID=3031916 RepID=UPI002405947E|nr:hypothetical protein [Halobaculum sp. YSMS11]